MGRTPAPPASAEAVARYFIFLASKGEPVPLTQMHLHKLLYYAQGARLGATGDELFAEPIEAWKHGPVVRAVYPVFMKYGKAGIPFTEGVDAQTLSREDRALVERVWKRLSRLSASGLRRRTHAEQPWQVAWGDRDEHARSREVISHDAMRRFFGAEQDEWCRTRGIDPEVLRCSLAQVARGGLADYDLVSGRPLSEVRPDLMQAP